MSSRLRWGLIPCSQSAVTSQREKTGKCEMDKVTSSIGSFHALSPFNLSDKVTDVCESLGPSTQQVNFHSEFINL